VTAYSSPRRSAVDRAVEELKTEQRAPLDATKIPGKTLYWRVLVEPRKAKAVSAGGIEIAAVAQQADDYLTTVGRVVQVGAFAFKSRTAAGLCLADEPNLPTVGDFVLYEQYAGQEIMLVSGHRLRILTDTEILMVITDPDAIRAYV